MCAPRGSLGPGQTRRSAPTACAPMVRACAPGLLRQTGRGAPTCAPACAPACAPGLLRHTGRGAPVCAPLAPMCAPRGSRGSWQTRRGAPVCAPMCAPGLLRQTGRGAPACAPACAPMCARVCGRRVVGTGADTWVCPYRVRPVCAPWYPCVRRSGHWDRGQTRGSAPTVCGPWITGIMGTGADTSVCPYRVRPVDHGDHGDRGRHVGLPLPCVPVAPACAPVVPVCAAVASACAPRGSWGSWGPGQTRGSAPTGPTVVPIFGRLRRRLWRLLRFLVR
ncbi:hypothetical protein HRbin30_01840 [bacterium HR30]|nr:hypothetical protein HRbin30_01840 [bacterium HR30]